MEPEKILICWSCKKEIEVLEKIVRNDHCPKCDMPLKCCYNCRFYDHEAHHKCRETQAEWVRYKEKANFCSYFVPRIPKPESKPKKPPQKVKEIRNSKFVSSKSPKKKQKSAWDNLFKD